MSKESYQDGKSSKEDKAPKVITNITQNQDTPEDEDEATEFTFQQVFTANNFNIEEKHEAQLLSNTENNPSQEDLSLNNTPVDELDTSMGSFLFVEKNEINQEQDDNSEKISKPLDLDQVYTSETILGRFSKIISQAVGNLAKAQPHECFDNFFKQSASNNSSVDNLAAISSCSQEDFNTKFIERARYFLQKETNIELEPSKIIIFLKTKINFIYITERAATETESLEVQALIKKCRHMMHTALEHYTKQQIKAIANDKRYFTADDMLMYIPEETRSLLKKSKYSEESVNRQFLGDIRRYNAKIKFFDNDKLLWDNSDPKALELAKKIKACDLELGRTSKNTQEYSDKSSELKEIETEVIQYHRSTIQSFINTDPEIVNILLLEQTQAAIAVPSGLHLQYCRDKLDDVFGADKENQARGTSDRQYEIEFHKKQDSKIIIRVVLHGSMKFLVDSRPLDDLYNYKVITEVEYDLQNLANNRITNGELKLFPNP